MADIHYHKLETGRWCLAMLLDMGYAVDLDVVEVDHVEESSPAAAVDAE